MTYKLIDQNGSYWKGKENVWWTGIDCAVELARKKGGIKILDIGCGDGSFFKYLKQRLEKNGLSKQAELVGVDFCGDYEDKVRAIPAKFVKADILKLSRKIAPSSFDFVVCSEVLEHVVETDTLVKEIKKVMKPDGILFITTPNLASYHARLSLLLGLQPVVTEVSNERGYFGKGFVNYLNGYDPKVIDVPVHHVRLFTKSALTEFLGYHGFAIEKIAGSDYRMPGIMKFFPSIAPVIQVLCRKM